MKSGFLKVKIAKINPDAEYVEENGLPVLDYTKNTLIVFEDNKGELFYRSIDISNDEVYSDKSNSYLYINCVGDMQFSNCEANLWDSFKNFERVLSWKRGDTITEKYVVGSVPNEKEVLAKKQFKIASKGEAELLSILKKVENPNVYDIECNLFFDFNKVLEGNTKNIEKRIKDSNNEFHLIILVAVDKKGNSVVYNKYLSLNLLKDINNDMNISNWNKKEWEAFKSGLEKTDLTYNLKKYSDLVDDRKQFTETDLDY